MQCSDGRLYCAHIALEYRVMSRLQVRSISPFFMVNDVSRSLEFYQKLGFTPQFQLPEERPFFAIAMRDGAMSFLNRALFHLRQMRCAIRRCDGMLLLHSRARCSGRWVRIERDVVYQAGKSQDRRFAWIRSQGSGWLRVVLRPSSVTSPSGVCQNDTLTSSAGLDFEAGSLYNLSFSLRFLF
jgi:hypothetical protein